MFNFFKKDPKDNFKFREAKETACFTCDHVLSRERPVLYVSHDEEDGSWQFLCGQDDHRESNARIISLKNVTEIDPSVNDLWEMPLGFGAERRTVKDKWAPSKNRELTSGFSCF